MPLTIEQKKSIAPYTTLHVGGVADYVAEVTSESELLEALQFAQKESLPVTVIGGGSNVLVSDEGFPGLLIINAIQDISFTDSVANSDEVHCRVGAGVVFDELIAETVERDLWGLENLSAIPGSVGATPIQNVGAYGVEVASLIESVTTIHSETFEKKTFLNRECDFTYRDSFFKTNEGKKYIVTEVCFVLKKIISPILSYKDVQHLQNENTISVKKIRAEIIQIRSKKFPDWNVIGTAGSFFKNPVITEAEYHALQELYPELPGYPANKGFIKVSLGWILDKVCLLRGYTEGNVGLYEAQALVLVANKKATATEINLFAEKISEKVFEKTKIKIEREVSII